MPRAIVQLETQIVCPQCGERFALDEPIVNHLQRGWERTERTRLQKELRAERAPAVQKEAQRQADRLVAAERRQHEEEQREQRNQVAQLRRQVTSLTRKLPPGRAQELGVVRQHTLVDILRARFPHDCFETVGRGVRGGDIIQTVMGPTGGLSGSILWESKRTSAFQRQWIRKLAEDQTAGRHDLAVLVCETLPDSDRPLAVFDGGLALRFEFVEDLAALLRDALIKVLCAKGAVASRDDLKGLVYDYLAGPEFANRVRSLVDTLGRMRSQLDSERRAMQRHWAERERQIVGVGDDIATVWGDLSGLGASLPSVASLELMTAASVLEAAGHGTDPAGGGR